MADYDIFREQLLTRYATYGHALWEPSPSEQSGPVKVGDVGFIRRGRFHRFFNALLSAEEQSNVPEHHEQLIPKSSDHITKGSLSSDHYCSAGISVEYEPEVHASSPDDLPRVSFLISRKRGAVLSLPVDARREDTEAMGDFREWLVKHIDHWFAFARERGLGIERMEEIILVTGCDHTRSWTNVAFFGDQYNAQASFGVNVFHGPPPDIHWQPLPQHVRGAVVHGGPGGTDLPEDQCVFIRGFRVTRTFWKLPKRLKAAAGPSSDLDDHDYDPDTEATTIPAVTMYRDPLHLLQDYIAERTPDCDMSLVHDDDLIKIYELGHDASPKTFEPDAMMDILQRSNIEINKVSYDSSPGNSGPNMERSMVKVAMLSMTSRKRGDLGDHMPPPLLHRPSNSGLLPMTQYKMRQKVYVLINVNTWAVGVITGIVRLTSLITGRKYRVRFESIDGQREGEFSEEDMGPYRLGLVPYQRPQAIGQDQARSRAPQESVSARQVPSYPRTSEFPTSSAVDPSLHVITQRRTKRNDDHPHVIGEGQK